MDSHIQAAYSALVADTSGVITGVDAEPGMVVAAGAPVLRLAHDGPRDVVFSVPEDKVGLIKAMAAQPLASKKRMAPTSTGCGHCFQKTMSKPAARLATPRT